MAKTMREMASELVADPNRYAELTASLLEVPAGASSEQIAWAYARALGRAETLIFVLARLARDYRR